MVIDFLKTWSPAKKLFLEKLVKKYYAFLLVTSQRGQILVALRIDNMDMDKNCYNFKIRNSDLKQGMPGYKPGLIILKAYSADKRLCIYNYFSVYLERTLNMSGAEKQLFLTTKKQYQAASIDTLSRWVKLVLKAAGIDTELCWVVHWLQLVANQKRKGYY